MTTKKTESNGNLLLNPEEKRQRESAPVTNRVYTNDDLNCSAGKFSCKTKEQEIEVDNEN